ncbi:MAG TPA: hypothetical protein VGJ13_04785 [Pseudonocardiaceae bacterium]|jgi:hypothetical protein
MNAYRCVCGGRSDTPLHADITACLPQGTDPVTSLARTARRVWSRRRTNARLQLLGGAR